MQILESSPLGLRAARLRFCAPSLPDVILFPVIHLADGAFFRQVYQEALSSDVVLVEGIRSPIVMRITRSYRWASRSKKLGLSLQPNCPIDTGLPGKIVNADVSAEEFKILWRRVPLYLRAIISVAAPVIGLRRRFTETRETLVKGLSRDDLPSNEEFIRRGPETAYLTEAILDARDESLIKALHKFIDVGASHVREIAIVYGAAHMSAVIRELTGRCGYRVGAADWMTVVEL
jgi:hypothetical protein